MNKAKELLLKCLPMLIVLVSTGIFALLIRVVIGIFYAPRDTVYQKEYEDSAFTVVQCYQNPSSYYYVYGGDFTYDGEKYDNVAAEHNNVHLRAEPIAYFVLNEPELDMENTTVKYILQGGGLTAVQLGEFVLYRLEGQYGVFAPLREYKESATTRKNDLYVVRQLLKNENYKAFDLPEWESEEEFTARLEKLEWAMDSKYDEDR